MNGINGSGAVKFMKNNDGKMIPVQPATTNFAFGGTALSQPRGLTVAAPNFSTNPFLCPANNNSTHETPKAPIFGSVSLFNTNVKPSTDLSG